MAIAQSPLKVVDLFSGAGGFSAGFEAAGFEIAAGLDFSPTALATFKANFPGAIAEMVDLSARLDDDVLDRVRGDGVHVVVGGPSCQGFSTSGGLSKGGRDEDDPRNRLFLNYLDIVSRIQPECVVFENVPGLLLYNKGSVARDIVSRFGEIGYTVVPMILLAADYGVPQLRRRLIFIGNRNGSPVPFPVPTHGSQSLWQSFNLPFAHLSRISAPRDALAHVTFGEACTDLPPIRAGGAVSPRSYASEAISDYQRAMRAGSTGLTMHVASEGGAIDKLAAKHLAPGENWTNIPLNLLPPRFAKLKVYDATSILRRLDNERPSWTITTKFNDATTGAFLHPTQARTLSLREAARLQSFPDRFTFHGSTRDIRQQIGNAVPPMLAQAIAESVRPSIARVVHGVDALPCRDVMLIDPAPSKLDDLIRLKGDMSRQKMAA